ncbi:MAG TPA: hypothetical protein VNJ10_07910 [Sphingomonas sp.]|nr:hypothetical protein [Sphingomonas sp.]
MSGAHAHPDLVPRTTLIGAGALVAFALAATSIVRLAGIAPAASPVLLRDRRTSPPSRRATCALSTVSMVRS